MDRMFPADAEAGDADRAAEVRPGALVGMKKIATADVEISDGHIDARRILERIMTLRARLLMCEEHIEFSSAASIETDCESDDRRILHWRAEVIDLHGSAALPADRRSNIDFLRAKRCRRTQ